ncbi:MAG: hypothetical protein QOG37_2363, partial [Mycobacterium sp.]|nr:hypothetical protein [Mycobacterium sp.]
MSAWRRWSGSGQPELRVWLLAWIFRDPIAAGSGVEVLYVTTCLSFDTVLGMTDGSKGWYHHQSARSPVGPGHGGTAGGEWLGARASDPALSFRPELSV